MTGTELSRARSSEELLSRRGFVQVGIAASLWSVARQPQADDHQVVRAGCENRSAIMICNYGGPSQLDTWDPKPNAPLEVRGPLRTIRTTVPGMHVSELFPRHAQIAHHLTLVRACYHRSPAVHAVGWQLMQTSRECEGGVEWPHLGCVVDHLLGGRSGLPGHVVLPGALHAGKPGISTGQSAGCLGTAYEPSTVASDVHSWPRRRGHAGRPHDDATLRKLRDCVDLSVEPAAARQKYGNTRLGRRCLAARRLVEAGVRVVTINTGGDRCLEDSWDVHGTAPFRPLRQLQQTVAPTYDQAVTALVEDLAARGLLASTLVCCLAEFGRTPRINPDGGRDHWPQCFSVCIAGGGVPGGQIIGRSDAIASEPLDRPVQPAEIVASIYHNLGIDPKGRFTNQSGNACELIQPGVESMPELS